MREGEGGKRELWSIDILGRQDQELTKSDLKKPPVTELQIPTPLGSFLPMAPVIPFTFPNPPSFFHLFLLSHLASLHH